MSKAFDWVNRDLLFLRLLLYGVDGKFYKTIKILYRNNVSCVKINNCNTEWFEISSGVRQGDTLSPSLFSLFINDLAVELKNLNIGIDINGKTVCTLFYADDIVLLAENEEDLQSLIEHVHKWCNKWKMFVNSDKTKVVHFRSSRKPVTLFKFSYGDMDLEIVKTYNYLGVNFDENLNFRDCIKARSDAASRAFGGIVSKCKQYSDVGYNTYCHLFDPFVVPVQDYACKIWWNSNINICDKITERAMRYYLGVNNLTPLPALYSEMGWLKCKYRHYIHVIRFWNRLVNMDNHRLIKHIFQSDALFFYWWRKSGSATFQINQNWGNFAIPNYASTLLPKTHRSIFAQFCCGILPLRVETGRRQRVRDETTGQTRSLKLEECVCSICSSGEVEDEYHFLLKCDVFFRYKSWLYKQYYA